MLKANRLPLNCSTYVYNISIFGIKFEGFTRNAVKISGFRNTECTNYFLNPLIKFCHFADVVNPNVACTTSCSAIHAQITEGLKIERCRIVHDIDVAAQTDGIYIDNSNEVEIRDNYILLQNNQTPPPGCGDPYYHIDCIQFADQSYGQCENIIIERNQLVQNGNHTGHSGIIMSGIKGAVKIFNNNIVATHSQNLLNLRFYDYTESLWIFNNTLVGLQNNIKLVGINNVSGDIEEILRLRNNIFYKQGGSNPVGITFFILNGSDLNNQILDYNLYHNPNTTMKIEIVKNGQSVSENWDIGPWEVHGTGVNPGFQISEGLYQLGINSLAKNRGQALQDNGLTSDYFLIKRPYWINGVDLGAFEIPEAQLRIGWVDGTAVEHTITAIGAYWEKEQDAFSWPVSDNPQLALNNFTPKSLSSNKEEWDGFHFNWMKNIGNERVMGHAFYKVSTGEGSYERFFYLDLRDAVTNYNPNIYIKYDDGIYWYWDGSDFDDIDDGSILRVWQINSGIPNTLSLTNYWSNALLRVDEGNNPVLIWGPYPDPGNLNGHLSGYKLYRSGTHVPGIPPTNYSVLYPAGINEFSYKDVSAIIGNDYNAYSYKTTAVILDNSENSFEHSTNIIEVRLARQSKIRSDEIYSSDYNLFQNYPNPFNPLTTISFNLPEDNKVELKVYDILGKEIKVILNENIAAGFYEIEFNAETLASGIYFYKISAGRYSETKKLQVIK